MRAGEAAERPIDFSVSSVFSRLSLRSRAQGIPLQRLNVHLAVSTWKRNRLHLTYVVLQ